MTQNMEKLKLAGKFAVSGYGNDFQIEPPHRIEVAKERYCGIVQFAQRGGYNDGTALRGVAACGCANAGSLCADTLHVFLADGREAVRGKDFDYNPVWGTFGFLPDGEITDKTEVFCTYAYVPQRLDSIVRNADGTICVLQGKDAAFCPALPEISQSQERLANILLDSTAKEGLKQEHLFPILEPIFTINDASEQRKCLPNTMKALNDKTCLRILAWGDSVTEGRYEKPFNNMCSADRWQQQTEARLRALYPACHIDMISNGWDGRSIPAFVNDPPGAPHNFEETVIAVRPNLVISEFINDASFCKTWEGWQDYENNYLNKVLAAFRQHGIEWIILTPHYSRPDWMGLSSQNGPELDNDPRIYTQGLRKFAAKNGVALADAALRYGHLWREGIPYNTLMTNCINHPNGRGLSFFADAILNIFQN